MNTLQPWQWGAIVILAGLILTTVLEVYALIVRAWRDRKSKPPYDWARDDGSLDVLARDTEGELLTVIPTAWRYK